MYSPKNSYIPPPPPTSPQQPLSSALKVAFVQMFNCTFNKDIAQLIALCMDTNVVEERTLLVAFWIIYLSFMIVT